ncbi:hypothetical protein [Massilia sp. CF038]|uniref:hypothetical protein n=1 Tax=Massilia sp. CF038 TaxID=1881045 RepID=UPI00091C682B|nr:hypothetical protein [Massilia sp. CF038]SHH54361.1 hypothetical protein SAMN05428948_4379 [Massilia sp. CF038]
MLPSRVLGVLLLCAVGAAAGAAPARPSDPLDAAASAPALQYVSAFAGYKSDAAVKAEDWKQTNAAIGKQPGHAGHDMGSMKAPDKPADKSPDPHAGHRH